MRKFTYLLFLPVLLLGVVVFSCTRESILPDATRTPGEALLIIDGKEYPYPFMAQVNPHDFQRIELYHSAKAAEKFGNRAAKGAISLFRERPGGQTNRCIQLVYPVDGHPDRVVTLTAEVDKTGTGVYTLVLEEAGNVLSEMRATNIYINSENSEEIVEQLMQLDDRALITFFTSETLMKEAGKFLED